jgi:chemotaxis signal transduction protein
MTSREGHIGAAALRAAFDRSFAQAVNAQAAATEDLLEIRIGADPYALRLSEIAGLFADKKVTRLPSPVAELIGVAGFRGTVVPVYDLGMLLGGARAGAPRWLVVTGAMQAAVAFERFDRYLTVPSEAIVPDARQGARERHVRDVVRTTGLVRPLISLTSTLEWIENRTSLDGVDKEWKA